MIYPHGIYTFVTLILAVAAFVSIELGVTPWTLRVVDLKEDS